MTKVMKEKTSDNTLLYHELKKYIQDLDPEIYYPIPYKKNINKMPPEVKKTSQSFVELAGYDATKVRSNIQKLAEENFIQLKQENEIVYFCKMKDWDKINNFPKNSHHPNHDSDLLAEIKKEITDLRNEISHINQRLAQKDAQIIKLTRIIRAEKET